MGACIPKQKPPTPLSVDNLLSMQENLEIGNMEADEKLRACLDHALREFPHEPRCLQDNATLVIQVRGRKRMEFVSGAGENKIVVSWLRRKTQYNVEIPNLEVYLGRLSLLPAPLTSENLVKVRQELIRWDDATKELCACLDVAITELEKEPPSVKRDAELTVECSNSCLTFISGKRRSHVHILFSDRHPRYQVRVSSIDVYLDRLSCRPTPLSAENLLKVWKETENLKGCTVDLRACLKRALQEFNALSPRHRANATIFIDCDGKNFKMVSGHGESWISVFNIVGDQHCRREVVLALGEIGTSSRVMGSNSGKGGKEGPSFRVRRSEGRSSAEEGPSSQAKRTSSGPKGPSQGKKAKRGPSNVVELEVFASSSRKGEEETTLLVERTFCSGRRADTGLPNCSKALVRERSLRSMVLSSSQKGKPSNENNEQEPAGSLGTSGGTATKEASIHGRCQETGKEREAASGSSEEEEPPDVLEESSDSKQAEDGPER
ncbi:Spindle pole body protein pcp1 [Varanus komodoensis]|nr:Spindle pole body protein pcp1 [Varanus komodoensis]